VLQSLKAAEGKPMNKPIDMASVTASFLHPDIQSFVLSNLDPPDAEERIEKQVRTTYRAKNPDYEGSKAVADAHAKTIARLYDDQAELTATKCKTFLFRISMPGPRGTRLAPHDVIVYYLTALAVALGVVIAWSALASYVSNSTVLPSLTNNYAGSWLLSGMPLTGAFLLEAATILYPDDASKLAYYRRIRVCAVSAVCAWVIVVSLTFAPHPLDTTAMAEAMIADGPSKTSFADMIKAVGPYFMVATQLFGEIFSAPVIFFALVERHLMGRPMLVVKNDTRAHLDQQLDALDPRILDLIQKQSGAQTRFVFHTDAENAEVAAAMHLYRHLATARAQNRARADETFMSKNGRV
jgi:hypothetical protein